MRVKIGFVTVVKVGLMKYNIRDDIQVSIIDVGNRDIGIINKNLGKHDIQANCSEDLLQGREQKASPLNSILTKPQAGLSCMMLLSLICLSPLCYLGTRWNIWGQKPAFPYGSYNDHKPK